MKNPINIVIIDDHKIVRKGLQKLIENLGNYKVISEYHNGINFLGEIDNLKIVPDLFIIDYSMPMCNGNEIIKKVLEKYPDYKFLLLTQHFEEFIIDDAYNVGARGFLHKNCSAKELQFAIDNIVSIGYTNISEILRRIRNFKDKNDNQEPIPKLSDNELTFLELVCNEKEYTYKEIAEQMECGIKNVDYYRGSLFSKFNVKSKVGLVLYSYSYKLTKPFI